MTRAEFRAAYGREPWWGPGITEGPRVETAEEDADRGALAYWRAREVRGCVDAAESVAFYAARVRSKWGAA